MGNTLRSHDDLVNVRGWTLAQISSAYDVLRCQSCVYSLTRDEFTRYFGGRNREAVAVFTDLDTDADGRVDVFEVFLVVTVWSGTSWAEKQDFMFKLFDMGQKGFLKVDEISLLSTVLVQTLRKFVMLGEEFDDPAFVKGWAKKAVPPGESKVTPEAFRSWINNCAPFEQLKGSIETHAARGQPDTSENRMRVRISGIERHSHALLERIEQLQDKLPDFAENCIDYVSALNRRKRWDFVMQNLRECILKLQGTSEQMHTTVSDLEQSLNEEELSGGTASMVDPTKRFNQEQMLINLERMREVSATDFREATELLSRLIELTEPGEQTAMGVTELLGDSLAAINEEEVEVLGDVAPLRVVENRNMMKQVCGEMAADCEDGHVFGRTADSAAGDTQLVGRPSLGGARALDGPGVRDALGALPDSDGEPVLMAIADFDPPPSHQAQMLRLDVGDVVTVMGQDGRGWWYGRKQNSKEGWFPPSYVQLKPAHFTSAGA